MQKARCPMRFRAVFGIARGEPVEG
jgi:hypothetical protein